MILENDNTFGVEIETVMPVASLCANGWQVGAYHVGADIPNGNGWKTMRDGSIQPSDYNHTGVEIVSPILRGAEGIASVDSMVARLRGMGATVNASCGLHVHVGFDGSAQQLANLISLVSYHEKALYASTGTKSREANRYCGSIKLAFKPLEKMRSMSELRGPGSNRYSSLNLQNLIDGRRPTVEFRVFAGTLNATKIKAYVQICLGLVQRAMSTFARKSSWNRKGHTSARLSQGASSVTSLLGAIGWSKHASNVGARVPVKLMGENHNCVVFGLVTPTELPKMRRILGKMAKKYDAAV